MADNNTILVGTLGRDPELRFTQTGRAVASFGMAVNRRWKGADDEWKEETSWFDVTCWGELAEHAAQSLEKGSRAIVTGRLEQQTWEDKQTGDKRSKVQLVADDLGPSLRWATAVVEKIQRDKATHENQPTNKPSSRPETPVEDPF